MVTRMSLHSLYHVYHYITAGIKSTFRKTVQLICLYKS